MTKFIGLSLFSSGGLSETYLDKTKVDIKLANELIKDRCKFYKHLYPNSNIINGSITDKNIYKQIIKEAKKLKVDFILATPPCQGMSKAGKMKVDDDRNILFLYVINIIKELKPKYILIENVPEFLKSNYINPETNNSENILDKIKKELGNKYNFDYNKLNSMDYEVPQSRNRAIMILSKKRLPVWKLPKKLVIDIKTVKDIIYNLPSLESNEKVRDKLSDDSELLNNINLIKWHNAKKHNDNHILWMKNTSTGETAFNNEVYYPKKDGRMIKGFKTTYKRIKWDTPAPTITMSSGSISSQNNVHPGRKKDDNTYSDARVLTVYEIILLTSLPYNWNIPDFATDKLIRDLVGECVPPKLMYHLIKSIPNL